MKERSTGRHLYCRVITETVPVDMSRGAVYLAVFVALVVAAAAWAAFAWSGAPWRKGGGAAAAAAADGGAKKERFTASEPSSAAAAAAPAESYRARLTVQRTFDEVVHRKPTPEEIDTYSKLQSDAAIREAITRDHAPASAASAASAASDASDAFDASEAPEPHSAGAGKRKASERAAAAMSETFGGSDSDDDDDDDDDDEEEEEGRGSGSKSNKKACAKAASEAPKPYSPQAIMKDMAAAPDLGWGGKKGKDSCKGTGCRRVCMERSDVLKRLEAIASEIDQFRQAVMMM